MPVFWAKLGAYDLNCVDVPINPTHSLTVTSLCVFLGHLAQDCFHRPGDKAYELIEDTTLMSSSADDVSHSNKKKVCHSVLALLLSECLSNTVIVTFVCLAH